MVVYQLFHLSTIVLQLSIPFPWLLYGKSSLRSKHKREGEGEGGGKRKKTEDGGRGGGKGRKRLPQSITPTISSKSGRKMIIGMGMSREAVSYSLAVRLASKITILLQFVSNCFLKILVRPLEYESQI